MTPKDRSTIERALGIIEGVACGVTPAVADMLITAVEMIDVVLLEQEKSTPTGSDCRKTC